MSENPSIKSFPSYVPSQLLPNLHAEGLFIVDSRADTRPPLALAPIGKTPRQHVWRQHMALVKCKECGQQVSNRAEACPACGAKPSKGVSVIKVIGALFFGAIAVLFFLSDRPGSGVTSAAGREATAIASLEATNIDLTRGKYGNAVIKGDVRNTTGKKLSYIQVELNLFDRSGHQVGSTLANANNVEPGTDWVFEAPVLEDAAQTVKVGGITAY